MGLDLTLLPFDHDNGEWAFSHTVLRCARTDFDFELLLPLAVERVPLRFYTYLSREGPIQEIHYGNTSETPYGQPLLYTTVRRLLPFKASISADDAVNRAVWAYLAELSPDTKVALFWT